MFEDMGESKPRAGMFCASRWSVSDKKRIRSVMKAAGAWINWAIEKVKAD